MQPNKKTMSTPKISVIVPVYNAEKFLRRCIDSVLSQTYKDFELLLINDGSIDASGDICDEYAKRDARIRVFHKQNGGASSARNVGLDNACGYWITFCDSDDYTLPDWLANYEIEKSEDFDLVQQGMCCDKSIFGKREKLNHCGFNYVGEPQKYIELLADSNMVGYGFIKAYKSNIIKQNGLAFNPCIRLQEDEVFFYQYMRYCRRVKSVDKQGYFYFAPEWERKYIRKNREIIELLGTLLPEIEAVVGKNSTVWFVREYKDLFVDNLVSEFSRHPKMSYLNLIRNLHVGDYGCSRLSKILKKIIVRDKSRVFSWFCLLVHSVLREKIKK